jgi:hypothetical protein
MAVASDHAGKIQFLKRVQEAGASGCNVAITSPEVSRNCTFGHLVFNKTNHKILLLFRLSLSRTFYGNQKGNTSDSEQRISLRNAVLRHETPQMRNDTLQSSSEFLEVSQ